MNEAQFVRKINAELDSDDREFLAEVMEILEGSSKRERDVLLGILERAMSDLRRVATDEQWRKIERWSEDRRNRQVSQQAESIR